MDSSKPQAPSLFARVLATLAVIFVYFVGRALPLPGIEWRDLQTEGGLLEGILEYSNFSVGALGMHPFVSAFITVEIVAVLVPRWRPLRNGSAKGRRQLVRASLITTFVLVCFQATAISQSMQEIVSVSMGSVFAAYVVWTAALLGLAHWAERFGALGGIQNLILAEIAFSLVKGGVGAEWAELGPEVLFQLAVFFLALPVLAGRKWATPVSAEKGSTLFPWFVGGIIPLTFATSALAWPSVAENFVDEQSPVREATGLLLAYPWWTLGVLVGALYLFAPAFYRRSSLQALSRLLRLGAEPVHVEKARYARSRNLSLIYLILVWGASLLVWREGVSIDVWTPFVLAALCLDAVGNLSFWAKHSDTVSLYQSHRVYRAVRIASALRARGLDVHLSGLRHRSLLHFFGPYVPVRVLVPATEVGEGQEILKPLIRDGLSESQESETDSAVEKNFERGARSQSAEKQPPVSFLPGLWVLLGLASMAGAVRLLPPEPAWEPIPSGTMALYEVDDSLSVFSPDDPINCEGVELREEWVSTESGSIHVAFSRDFELLAQCVEAVELPEERQLLFERVFALPSADLADEFRQELVGWQTVLVADPPAIHSEDLWGFYEAENGSLLFSSSSRTRNCWSESPLAALIRESPGFS